MGQIIALKKNHEFRRMYRRGRQAVSPMMVLYCRRNNRDDCRVGFTVSVKVGNAVTRNRIRRRLREVYRLHRLELKTGFDLILVGRIRAKTASWRELNSEFLRLCRELRIMERKEPVG